MDNLHLHIISFDVPYPPDYGGVIDVFYKIKALHAEGVKIHLHCFTYKRDQRTELEAYCASVTYYRRDKMWKGFLSDKPFIVHSRNAPDLLHNLRQDTYPVLFEGLHCCFHLPSDFLWARLKIVRMHNNEADYYLQLAKRENKLFTQLYFYAEYRRLIRYEQVLTFADKIYCISKSESEQYHRRFATTEFLAPFHGNDTITSKPGKGEYILYHGNLSVNENHAAAQWLIENVFPHIQFPCVIAGNAPDRQLIEMAGKYPHIRFEADPDKQKMDDFIRHAQLNVLPAFQSTGIKLKLINALFNGRFCVANTAMACGTGMEKYCTVADTAGDMVIAINSLLGKAFTEQDIQSRKVLIDEFSDKREARKIISLLQSRILQ